MGNVSERYDAVVLDIEGTVCPISFVREELFPYFVRQMDRLEALESDKEVALLVQRMREEQGVQDVGEHVRDLVRRDVKDPILKQLQGHVWQRGYETGEIKAPIYGDAIRFIEGGFKGKIYIYSSGSVKAQKLLFQYVADPQDAGAAAVDLTRYLAGYFDIQTSGVKTEKESYKRILRDIGLADKARNVLFISDNVRELDAATEAGMDTMLAVRPGNDSVANVGNYVVVKDFGEL
ncbi:putative acireductone synthase UTR4 Ecym_3571 [Eremothecium cymbalariae DBVPG|uniref:Enolase-phosphatase E1 n=1 Tax=Eremothecium cymbalariae (strain CBS 270.75 / DBVPG 7215 / KCTC 17166 / NRRL Y-17582) TaxID=931890 RepID=G8JQQ7_ERECY|nr:Hypothetical protein Ecym_3571 [Eremothecium cymbalariae DBVPG\